MSCCCVREVLELILEPRVTRLYQIMEEMGMAGPKEKAALKALDDALDKLKAWQDAQDENDASALNQRVESINQITGGSTTVNPSQPIDATTGQNLPPTAEQSTNPDLVGQSEPTSESSSSSDESDEEDDTSSGSDPFSRNA